MKYLVTAAAAALMSAGAGQAATVDLAYTVEAQIIEVTAFDVDGTRDFDFTREIGDVEVLNFTVRADTDTGTCETYIEFACDLASGAGRFYFFRGDSAVDYELNAEGTGTIMSTLIAGAEPSTGRYTGDLEDISESLFENIDYDVLSYSVEGLPEIAPVPLPASLPLLALGIAALGVSRRQQRRP